MTIGGPPVRTNSEIHGRTFNNVVVAPARLRAECSDALEDGLAPAHLEAAADADAPA